MPRLRLTTVSQLLRGTLCAIVLTTGMSRSARAQSASDSTGALVAPGFEGVESIATAIPDSLGGAFVAFVGNTFAPDRVSVAAHLGPDGMPVPGWSSAPISDLNHLALPPSEIRAAVAPARPGAIWMIADWADVGQRFNRLVGPGGPTLPETSAVATRFQGQSVPVPLGNGRTLIQALLNSAPATLRVSVLDSTCVLDTTIPDAPLVGGPGFPNLVAIPDGLGGAISAIVVSDIAGSTGKDLLAVRLDRDGRPMWSPAARVLTAAARDQTEARLCSDGSGGAFFVWTDNRSLSLASDVYALHLLADGSIAPGWPPSWVPLASGHGDQFQPQVAEDGRGGCWVVWTDSRSGENDIYYTRLGPSGAPAPGFPAGGRILCGAPGGQITPEIVADGADGFFAVWLDDRNGNGNLDLYGQHIHATGEVMPGWTADGVALCTNPSRKSDPLLVLSAPNHAIAIWLDTRTVNPKYYAMVLPADGAIAGVSGTRAPRLEISRRGSGRDIEFNLLAPGKGAVRVSLFDVTGRRIGEQLLRSGSAQQQVRFATNGLRTGLYLARARQDGSTAVGRAFLIR